MQTILNVLHLFLAIGLVGLVLIQHGKGADAGAAFGSGASATVFGARGSGNFLSRATAILATMFFLTSMALAYFASQVGEPEGLMDGIKVPSAPAPEADELRRDVPVVPGTSRGGETTDVPAIPSSGAPAQGEAPSVAPLAGQPEAAPAQATDLPAVPASASDNPVVTSSAEAPPKSEPAAEKVPAAAAVSESGVPVETEAGDQQDGN